MQFEDILLEREAPLAVITFNRPSVLNALRTQLLKEVARALEDVEADDAIRVVIITGAGEKAFAAGADISELNSLASGFADSINNQLAAGVDSNNNVGAALFAYNAAAPAGTLAVSSTITPAEIAAASAGNQGGNDNAVALDNLQSATTLGGFTFTQAYGNLAANVGSDISNSQNEQTTQQSLLAQA